MAEIKTGEEPDDPPRWWVAVNTPDLAMPRRSHDTPLLIPATGTRRGLRPQPDRAREFCSEFGFARAYSDIEAPLSRRGVDGCVCVLPMERIVDLAVMLLERKIPSVIEKPLGVTPEESERLADVARQTGTPHMVSVNRRFMPYLNQAKSWASSIGPLQYVRATQIRHARDEPDFIWSTAIHVLDALRHVAGEVAEFHTEVHRQGLSTVWYVVSLRFESGASGRIEVLPTAGMVEESYDLFGEDFAGESWLGQAYNVLCRRGAMDKSQLKNTSGDRA